MKTPTILSAALLSLTITSTLIARQVDTTKLKPFYFEVNDYVEENEHCLRCHGEVKFLLEDPALDRAVYEHMCPDRQIDRDAYYSAVHKGFSCTDCHSYDFNTFPHPLEARLEDSYECLDCHGYDETFAQYHFEDIAQEFQESIHNMDDFTCWKCHNPHSYKAFMRNADDLGEAIVYDNNICLNCHANFSNFTLLTDRAEINVVQSHEWLPNQASHFSHVRCIECHTEINDSILIAHKILPKTEAVKRCTECHSTDSRLMYTLYKFQIKKERKAGFANGIIINQSYVIGANQNLFLNRLSILVFLLTFLVILLHTFLRIRNLKNK